MKNSPKASIAKNSLHSKAAAVREVGGDSERRTGLYTTVPEDSSTESTPKFPSAVGFGIKSNEWQDWLHLCSQFAKQEELRDFFALFLTAEEKADLAKRYIIVRELLKGELTQREIAKQFHVSIAKITRGSNMLKELEPTIKQQFIQLLNKEA